MMSGMLLCEMLDTGPKGSDPNGLSQICNTSCYIVICILLASFLFHLLLIFVVAYCSSLTDTQTYLRFRVYLHDRFCNSLNGLKTLEDVCGERGYDEAMVRFSYRGHKFVSPNPSNAIVESMLHVGRPFEHDGASRWEDVELRTSRLVSPTAERCVRFERPLFPGECIMFSFDASWNAGFVFGLVGSKHPHFAVPGRSRCSFGVLPCVRSVLFPGSDEMPWHSQLFRSPSSLSRVVFCYPEGFTHHDQVQRPLVVHVFIGGRCSVQPVLPSTQRGHILRSLRDPSLLYERVAVFHIWQDMFSSVDSEAFSDTRHLSIPALYPAVGLMEKEGSCKFNISMGPIPEPLSSAGLTQTVPV